MGQERTSPSAASGGAIAEPSHANSLFPELTNYPCGADRKLTHICITGYLHLYPHEMSKREPQETSVSPQAECILSSACDVTEGVALASLWETPEAPTLPTPRGPGGTAVPFCALY